MSRATTEERPAPVVRAVLSFDEVYDRHFRFVWRVLRASGLPPSQVEDAAQDVFVVVHRRLSEFEGRSDIRTWLFRIASWVVTSERRKLRNKRQHEASDEAVSDVRDRAAGPFELLERSEAIKTLERILGRMDPEKRMAFLLMDIEEMKAGEVAELLEINVNTVYSRLRLAREQFKLLVRESAKAPEGSAP
ncbi:MAG: polymerase sigma factor RpoE [Myxococcaceae bacterium]|nr:polymerase sigma factor RpoE [Myxococcaceae bacterium]